MAYRSFSFVLSWSPLPPKFTVIAFNGMALKAAILKVSIILDQASQTIIKAMTPASTTVPGKLTFGGLKRDFFFHMVFSCSHPSFSSSLACMWH